MINIGHETYHSHVENDLPQSFIHMQILHKPTWDNVSPKVGINYLRQGIQYITCCFCSWNWRNTKYTQENKLDIIEYELLCSPKDSTYPTNQGKIEHGEILRTIFWMLSVMLWCVTTLIVNPRKMLWRNSLNSASTSVFYKLQMTGYILSSFLLEDISQPTSLIPNIVLGSWICRGICGAKGKEGNKM